MTPMNVGGPSSAREYFDKRSLIILVLNSNRNNNVVEVIVFFVTLFPFLQ